MSLSSVTGWNATAQGRFSSGLLCAYQEKTLHAVRLYPADGGLRPLGGHGESTGYFEGYGPDDWGQITGEGLLLYLRTVAICYVIAAPIGWLVVKYYLQQFAHRVGFMPSVLVEMWYTKFVNNFHMVVQICMTLIPL